MIAPLRTPSTASFLKRYFSCITCRAVGPRAMLRLRSSHTPTNNLSVGMYPLANYLHRCLRVHKLQSSFTVILALERIGPCDILRVFTVGCRHEGRARACDCSHPNEDLCESRQSCWQPIPKRSASDPNACGHGRLSFLRLGSPISSFDNPTAP